MNILSVVGIRTVGGGRATLISAGIHNTGRRGMMVLGRKAKFAILFLLSCVSLFIQQYNHPTVVKTRLMATEVMLPVVQVVNKPFGALKAFASYIHSYQSLVEENVKLKSQNEFLVKQHNQVQYQVAENQLLRQALNIKEILTDEVVATHVVHQVFDGISRHYFVNATVQEGVSKDNPVLTTQGYLCGRVIEIGMTSSRFMPIFDVSSRIPVQIEHNKEQGILAGEGLYELSLIHVENMDHIKVGDRLITSGIGGVFPPGLPVATVSEVSKNSIKAQPLASTRDLDFVLIVTK
jgi:rod shape-determining protein MreC